MKAIKIYLSIMLPLMAACSKPAEEPHFEIDGAHVISLAREMIAAAEPMHYADQWTAPAIANDTCALWIGRDGVVQSADVLLGYLLTAEDEGLSPDFFGVSELQARVDSIRAWTETGRHALLTDTIAAEIEAGLTMSLMRYVYGQRYGYVSPRKIYNNLLLDYDTPPDRQRSYRQLYDIPSEEPTDSLSAVTINCLRNDSIDALLLAVQPDSKRHRLIAGEYKRAVEAGDSARAVKAIVNLERNRWRYQRPDTGRYVLVNLAAQSLWAVDARRDTCIEMRICCGNLTHKSPMLMSELRYIELNPCWNVPLSILRNEVARTHVNDSAYFARNRMTVINYSTLETVDPTTLTAAQWSSGRYALKQESGAGNSLGRLVFRFPNAFSVYLHDTNAPGAFARDSRTVSHGCIRVQRPMDLATFLVEPECTPLYIDRIRMSIDLQPLTPEGKRLQEKEPKPLKRYDFKHKVPLWIDYYTLYPDRHGKICEYPDIYSYDTAIADALKPYCKIK